VLIISILVFALPPLLKRFPPFDDRPSDCLDVTQLHPSLVIFGGSITHGESRPVPFYSQSSPTQPDMPDVPCPSSLHLIHAVYKM
jgi:hypothetical protein